MATPAELPSDSPSDKVRENGLFDSKPEIKSRFKNFWSKNTLKKPLRFIQYSTENDGEAENKQESAQDAGRRRTQNYEAKQRHEARKADYVKSLEQEIKALRNNTAAARKETAQLTSETRTLRNVALAYGIDVGIREAPLNPPSWDEYANVEIGFDVDVQAERSFVRRPQLEFQNHVPTQAASGVVAVAESSVSQGDMLTYAVLDFILALEHICRDHIHYPWEPQNSHNNTQANDHMFTATASIYSYCLPEPRSSHTHLGNSSGPTIPPTTDADWRICYADLEKLLQLSDNIPLPPGDITPVQAFRHVKAVVPQEHLLETLKMLKHQLGPAVRCWGFGASMSVGSLNAALATLGMPTNGALNSSEDTQQTLR